MTEYSKNGSSHCRNDSNEDLFTYRAILQTLSNLSSQKKLDTKDQNSTQKNIIRAMNKENNSFYTKKPSPSTNIIALRRSLKQQVREMKAKPRKTSARTKNGFNQHETVENYPENGFSEQQWAFLENYDELSSKETLDAKRILQEDTECNLATHVTRQPMNRTMVYSRHLQRDTDDTENSANTDEVCSNISVNQQKRKMRRASSGTASVLSTTSSRKNSSHDNVQSLLHSTEKETDFVSNIEDDSLKDSMQKILQRRKSTVCLFKSSKGGLKVLNGDEAFSAISEEKSTGGSTRSRSNSVCSDFGSLKSDFDEMPLNFDQTDDNIEVCGKSACKEDTPKRKGILKNRSNQSARSLQSNDPPKAIYKIFTKSLSSSNVVETEETKTIRPLSVKQWRPSLVPKQNKKRTNTAHSCPETRKEKAKIINKTKGEVVRDFILMYAKVKNEKVRNERETLPPEVRMMSGTPEFVVKSAIGQFLSSPFPSERDEVSVCSKEEKHEAMQRTRLLRIKNCMQQLASLG